MVFSEQMGLLLVVSRLKAIIMAGGRGTRLYPMTMFMPKQLILIRGHPVLQYIIRHCMRNGVRDFVLCISNNSFKHHFFNAVGDGSQFRARIEYSIAPEETNTAGRILAARRLVGADRDFLVYYGDIVTNLDLRSMIRLHRQKVRSKGCISTLALSRNARLEVGVGYPDESSRVIDFKERPRLCDVSEHLINIGIAVCNSRIFKYCSSKTDLFADAIPKSIRNNEFVCAYVTSQPFVDIGTFSALESALEIARSP